MSGSQPAAHAVARFEIALAILLGAAALASAGSAYLANSDDGNQLKYLQHSSQTRAEANDAYAAGDKQLGLDQTIFIEYVTAHYDGDSDLADYFGGELSPTLKDAIAAWQQDDEAVTPFSGDEPIYHPAQYDDGDRFDARADREFAKADFYDARGDDFVLATVIFAAALGLLGIGGVLSRWRNKLAFAGAGTAALIGGIVFVGTTL